GILCCAVLCAAAIAVGAAQTAGRGPAVDRDQLLSDLKTLSADEMEGRRVDTPGGAKARAFVVRRFKESGLVPFGASYEHPFTFTGRTGGRSARLPPSRDASADRRSLGGGGQPGDAAAEQRGVNVLGRIEGTRQPARYIVVSAHYDHIGIRDGQVFN